MGNTYRKMATTLARFISKKKSVNPQNQEISILLAFSLLPLSGFTTDIYVPSFPDMAVALHTTNINVQSTLTFFLISYGLGQLFIGGVLDCYGRYWIGVGSLIIFSLASLAIASVDNIYMVDLMRIVQGLTVSAIITGKRAYFVDLFTGKKLSRYLSLFSTIWSIGPIIAPFLGGYLQSCWGWTSNFYALAIVTLIIAFLELIFSGETLRRPTAFNFRYIQKVYRASLGTPSFIFGVLMIGVAYSIMMIYNMTGSFIIEYHLHLSAIVAGYGSLVMGMAWLCGGLISRATIMAALPKKLIWANGLLLFFLLFMFISDRFVHNLYSLLFFASTIQACAGYIFNNLLTHCMGMFPQNAGIAIGLTGGINLITTSALSYVLVCVLPAKDEKNLCLSYIMLVFFSLVLLWLLVKKSAQPANG